MYTYVYTEPAVNGIYRVEIEIRGACRTEEKRREEKRRKEKEEIFLPFLESWQQVPDSLPPPLFSPRENDPESRRKNY